MTTVLCVDDNAALTEILSELLSEMGFSPRTAPGGKECLESLKKEEVKPDIILLDIMMEPMDGWATLRNLKGDPSLWTIPVVMLTGKYPTMSEVNEFGPCIDGYLMKPFAIETLSHEIGTVLDSVRRREEYIDRAGRNGADKQLLIEFRRLSSCVSAMKQLEGIMKNGTFKKDALLAAEKQLESIRNLLDKQISHTG